MKTLLLTGWLGYIGSHTALVFLEQWYEIIILDNCSNTSVSVRDKIEKLSGKSIRFYHTDLRNKEDIETIFSENHIDGVIHFAWAKAVWESCEKPFYYYENNILWSLNLFECMERYGVKDIIFSSSATVYDGNYTAPFSESSPSWNTTNPYGTTKFVLEYILRDLALHKNMRAVSLRYFNPIGAHSSGLLGENPEWIPNNLLPFVMKVASGELKEVSIYGDDYDTVDGTGMRDYIHVMDLAEWHMAAIRWLESKENKGIYEVFNLGTGQETSVLEMIHIAQQVSGVSIKYSIQDRRNWDIATAYCSPQKAKELLGWEAKRSVEEAVRDSWNFIQTQ
jgi:UDP-glucose 4-epimerase